MKLWWVLFLLIAVPSFAGEVKCGEYQHVVHHPAYAAVPDCATGTNDISCATVIVLNDALPDTCEDDMHVVTERDWQTVLDRLRDLEAIQQKAGTIQPTSNGIVLPTPQ